MYSKTVPANRHVMMPYRNPHCLSFQCQVFLNLMHAWRSLLSMYVCQSNSSTDRPWSLQTCGGLVEGGGEGNHCVVYLKEHTGIPNIALKFLSIPTRHSEAVHGPIWLCNEWDSKASEFWLQCGSGFPKYCESGSASGLLSSVWIRSDHCEIGDGRKLPNLC